MLRGSAWTLHAPRWERSPSLPTETRNLQPNPGSVKKGTLGLFRVRGGSGSCQRHGKRGAGGRAAASSPSQRRHSDRSQPCESLSKRWEPRWWRCHWAGSPRGSTEGEPAPPMPSAPSISTHLPRHGAQPGASSFPVCISQKRRLRAGGDGLTPPKHPSPSGGAPCEGPRAPHCTREGLGSSEGGEGRWGRSAQREGRELGETHTRPSLFPTAASPCPLSVGPAQLVSPRAGSQAPCAAGNIPRAAEGKPEGLKH